MKGKPRPMSIEILIPILMDLHKKGYKITHFNYEREVIEGEPTPDKWRTWKLAKDFTLSLEFGKK